MPRQSNKVLRPCIVCGTEFLARPSDMKKGGGKYCSRACWNNRGPELTGRNRTTCEHCGRSFFSKPSRKDSGRGKFCSRKCMHAARPKRHVNKQGYVLILIDGHWRQEHRVVMEIHLGRPLTKRETVHHIDGDRAHNAIENLQLRKSAHGKGAVYRCRCCGSYDVVAEKLG